MIIFVVKRLKDLGWNNVGPTWQTVAQHYFTFGPMYLLSGLWPFGGITRHPYGSKSKQGTITQFCFNVGPASNSVGQY